MSEEIIPDVPVTSDVLENEEPVVNYSAMSLAELADMFQKLAISEDRMKRSKEAEAIKSAFYKRLLKERAEAGSTAAVQEPGSAEEDPAVEAEISQAPQPETEEAVSENPFDEIERGFKALYNAYRKEKAEYNRQLEKEREHNLELKEAVIADLKALVEKQEDVNATFPAFREIQNRWRAIGPVPVQNYRNLNDTYQLYVEQFYDMVKINRELRDLDFKKNLEAKEKFCEAAEKLAEKENVVDAFKELQKLHEQWKEYGPVAKQFREDIWNRFKAATAVINKKYQAYFEGQKEQYAENLAAKTLLCEKVEAIAEKEIKSSGEWNDCTKEIEEIQKQWKGIGYASKKENQRIYERFRAACDKFFDRKREFYSAYKDEMNDNLQKKIALCEAAEALKTSTAWKKTTDQLINLQKQWKEIGAVPRKKSEALWKRFRAACDEFFNERDKQAKPENDYYGNLKAKKHLIEEINAYVLADDDDVNAEAAQEFSDRWQSIGFVPFKEKDKIADAYKEAMQAKFPEISRRPRGKAPKNEKERLVQKYLKKEQDIVTYENNIGFFAASKNSEPLIRQMQERIDKAKEELKELELQIRALDSAEEKE
ncbi:MAG: DUF349 domain-containing protein [Bacteroidetes bacterium]|uniref:DUF349 domain-containing protein n=1 Tax=Candidatus Cryptobacteroides excrementipullorum TaxID=2840761 RepID=A0A9D9ITK0_9BACT|nr:DUF349 domain-containing protein [Candidatus Cryptobacteroides excrementipullorum]